MRESYGTKTPSIRLIVACAAAMWPAGKEIQPN